MPTFSDAYTRLLRAVNRPSSETDVLAGAKDAINDAIDELQRNHAYAHSEGISQFTYPASSFYVLLDDVCEGLVRDMLSLQETKNGALQGKPIKMFNYAQLQADRMAYYRTHQTSQEQTFDPQMLGITIEDGYRQDMLAFVMADKIGLYPTPANDVELVLNLHVWLPRLVNASDTNFFLTYGLDVVMMIALKKMQIYMKCDDRYPFSAKEVENAQNSMLQWDSQVRENPNTQIR